MINTLSKIDLSKIGGEGGGQAKNAKGGLRNFKGNTEKRTGSGLRNTQGRDGGGEGHNFQDGHEPKGLYRGEANLKECAVYKLHSLIEVMSLP